MYKLRYSLLVTNVHWFALLRPMNENKNIRIGLDFFNKGEMKITKHVKGKIGSDSYAQSVKSSLAF